MDPRDRERQEEKARERKALLDRAYDRVITSQLNKLASKKTVTEDDEEAYRQKIAQDRERATSKKRKAISSEHAELARTTGLSGQVVALMAGHDSDHDDNHDDDNSIDDSGRSDDGCNYNRKRKKKPKKSHSSCNRMKDAKKKKSRKSHRKYSSPSDSEYFKDTKQRSDYNDSDGSYQERRKNNKRRRRDSDSSSSASDSSKRGYDRKKSKKRKKHKSKSSHRDR